jgi:hypothetical protein
VAQLYPRALRSLFVPSYDSQGYGGILTSRLTGKVETLNQSRNFMDKGCIPMSRRVETAGHNVDVGRSAALCLVITRNESSAYITTFFVAYEINVRHFLVRKKAARTTGTTSARRRDSHRA